MKHDNHYDRQKKCGTFAEKALRRKYAMTKKLI